MQKAKFEGQIAELKQKCREEEEEVSDLAHEDLIINCLDPPPSASLQIAHQKQQLSQQETSKRAQMEEIANLQEQLESLQREEKEYKKKVMSEDKHPPPPSESILHLSRAQVEASRAELEKLQKMSQTIQNDITMVSAVPRHTQDQTSPPSSLSLLSQTRHKLDSLKEEHQTLGTALTMYPPVSTPGSTPSSSVVNINDVVHLSGDLHAPHLAEQDAISARATVSPLINTCS